MPKQRNSKVFDSLTKIIEDNYTPDRPILRFKGPQYVFIWDKLLNESKLRSICGMKKDEEWKWTHWRASTVDKFIPIANGGKAQYLPDTKDWVHLLSDDLMPYKSLKTLPVQGRILSVSLSGLEKLDQFYHNTLLSYRKKLPVFKDQRLKETLTPWVYLHPFHRTMKYNPHTQKYKFPSEFDVSPLDTNHMNPDRVVYEYDTFTFGYTT